MQTLESTIRQHLVQYLAGRLTLDAFTDWFVGISWEIGPNDGAEARELVYAIELALAETSGGYMTVEELDTELRAISQDVHLIFSAGADANTDTRVRIKAESGAETMSQGFRQSLRSWIPLPIGTRSAVVSW